MNTRKLQTKVRPDPQTKVLAEVATNPFLQRVAELAPPAAVATKARERAQDKWWLKEMEKRGIERESETFEVTSYGVAAPADYQRRLQRARAESAGAEAEYLQAERREKEIVAELSRAQASAREWDRRGMVAANYAAQEAALSPRERALRDARRLLDDHAAGR